MLNREILDSYKRDLTSGSIDFSVSPEQYKKDKLSQYTTAAEVLNGIYEVFNRVNDDAEAADGGETGEVMPEPHSETSEPAKPKRGKSKAGDEK